MLVLAVSISVALWRCGCVAVLSCGRVVPGQHVVNATQVTFARHRNGYIMPVLLSVTPVGAEVAGIMQAIDTDEHHILFREDNLVVTAATSKSLWMMGVSGSGVVDAASLRAVFAHASQL